MEMAEEGAHEPDISTKRLKFDEIVEKGGEDRISALQDCLILEILSRLPSTEDAIRTGTLSKRWKHVWTSVPTLSFASTDYYPFTRCLQNPISRSDFFSLVDKTLTQCRPQLNLKKFEVCSGCDVRFESQVNNWIRYAISRDVEELNLMFWNMESIVEVMLNQLIFTSSCIRDLTLEGCKLNPSGAISWKNLRSLSISDANLDEDLIENILSGSPLLETLELNCGGYKRLNITSKSVKKLVFSGYRDDKSLFGDDIIEINAPHILSLQIQDNLNLCKFLLVDVSSLVEANLDYETFWYKETMHKVEEEMLKGLILNLRHVKKLKIGVQCTKVVSRLKALSFVFPSNVEFLESVNWSESDSDLVESQDL